MSRFIITIAPENGDAADAASAQTTVRVDTSTGRTRITELTVRAADGGGLAPADLPAVDLELLIRALAAPAGRAALPTDAGTEVVHLAPPAGIAEAVEPSEVSAEPSARARGRGAGRSANGRRAGASRRAGAARAGGRAGAAKAGGRTAAKKAAGRVAAGTDTGARAGRTAAAARATGRARKAASGERETRAYRRMPDAAEVLAAYQDSGSITKLAEHYGVPRHTANGWARRLRGQGYAIGRS
jgi:hypothetical protein